MFGEEMRSLLHSILLGSPLPPLGENLVNPANSIRVMPQQGEKHWRSNFPLVLMGSE